MLTDAEAAALAQMVKRAGRDAVVAPLIQQEGLGAVLLAVSRVVGASAAQYHKNSNAWKYSVQAARLIRDVALRVNV